MQGISASFLTQLSVSAARRGNCGDGEKEAGAPERLQVGGETDMKEKVKWKRGRNGERGEGGERTGQKIRRKRRNLCMFQRTASIEHGLWLQLQYQAAVTSMLNDTLTRYDLNSQ